MNAEDGERSPFLIATMLGDGTEAEIPAADYGELTRLLERMSAACEVGGTPTPATVIWRFDRGAPRPMSMAELQEGDLQDLPILADRG